MLLSSLKTGSSAVISSLATGDGMRRRLHEIGFIPGAAVKCVMRSPLGEPAAYEVCGTLIALRDSDAETVYVEECEN